MAAFRFRLERVLAWRKTQLGVEEAALQRFAAAIAELDRTRDQLRQAVGRAEIETRQAANLHGSDLGALDGFRRFVDQHQKRLAEQRSACVKSMEEQRQKMLEARRRCRLLERLREHRLAEWQNEQDRELENFASEAFLARFSPPG